MLHGLMFDRTDGCDKVVIPQVQPPRNGLMLHELDS